MFLQTCQTKRKIVACIRSGLPPLIHANEALLQKSDDNQGISPFIIQYI